MSLCHYSEAPYLSFLITDGPEGAKSLAHMERCGFGFGTQLPFRGKNQAMVWARDSFENIRAAYEEIFPLTHSIAHEECL
jgi:hypothetical protein